MDVPPPCEEHIRYSSHDTIRECQINLCKAFFCTVNVFSERSALSPGETIRLPYIVRLAILLSRFLVKELGDACTVVLRRDRFLEVDNAQKAMGEQGLKSEPTMHCLPCPAFSCLSLQKSATTLQGFFVLHVIMSRQLLCREGELSSRCILSAAVSVMD